MKILALEFSSPQRSVAVLESRTGVPPLPLGEAVDIGGSHTRAFALIDQALEKAGLTRDHVDCIAVGLGPGSYTGIRIAISMAQGWQLARDVRVLGVSSVECLAHQARADGITGRLDVLIDAQRNEFYLATYELEGEGPRELEPLRLATLAETQARCQAGGTRVGFDVQRHFPETQVICPHAGTLARLAAARTDFIPGNRLEPIYLRATSFMKAPLPRFIS